MKNSFKIVLILLIATPTFIWGVYYTSRLIQEPTPSDYKFLRNAPGKFLGKLKGGDYTHYQIFGPDTGKPIILIHGGGAAGSYVWTFNFPALLKAGYRVYMYDLYGRGYSKRVDKPHTLALFSNQLSTFIDSMAFTRPVSLVALSLGAMPAIDYASKNPSKISELILVDPAALNSPFKNKLLKTPIINKLMMTFYWHPKSIEKQMNEFYAPSKMVGYRDRLAYFSTIEGYEDANLSTWLGILSENVREQLTIVGKNNTSTTLIFGENDPYFSRKSAAEFHKIVPKIKEFSIPKAGHISNYEQPKLVNEILLEVLKESQN